MGWQDAPLAASQVPAKNAWEKAPILGEEEGVILPLSSALRQHFQTQARTAKSFDDYIAAGFQQSVSGLAARGKAPDVQLSTETPWYGRLAASVAGLVGDVPAMVPGFLAGAPAGGAVGSAFPVIGTAIGAGAGGFAGANALPAALRTVMMDAYTKGEVKSSSEFIERALHVAWETTKGGVVGAATFGAGSVVAKTVGKAIAPSIGQALAVPTATKIIGGADLAAQLTTMTTVGKALEGKLPEPQDFMDAAILIGGLGAAGATAGKLRTIYAKTGVTPEQVLADATQNPLLKLDLKPVEKPTAEPSVTAYHGSPHTFEQFDTGKIGTGEGAQAFGHGLYFAENSNVAKGYQLSNNAPGYMDVKRYQLAQEAWDAATAKGLSGIEAKREAISYLTEKAKNAGSDTARQQIYDASNNLDTLLNSRPGALYKVQIPQRVVDAMLDWDKPLSEQPTKVKELANKIFAPRLVTREIGSGLVDVNERGGGSIGAFPEGKVADVLANPVDYYPYSGKQLYEQIAGSREIRGQGGFGIDPEAASRLLAENIIPGIRYLDQGSRTAGEGTRNFVIFDPANVRITERNGTAMDVPRAYAPAAISETARAIVPGDKAVAVAKSPFAEVEAIHGEPKPTHVNYERINSTEDAKLAMARISEIYEAEIQQQRRGTVSWEQTEAEATKMLSDTLGGVDQRLLAPRKPGTPAGAAEIFARRQLAIGSAEAMMAARDELLAKGPEATPSDKLAFLAATERAAIIQAELLGARAEAGRALNILKTTAEAAKKMQMIQDVINLYGGKDPIKLAEMLKSVDTAAGALKWADLVTKAGTWDKVIEAWKAGLLSGPVTHLANLIGNTTFAALRVPIDATAAGIGLLRNAKPGERVAVAEPAIRMFAMLEGAKDGAKVAAEAWRTFEGDQNAPGKSEQYRHAIEGKKGEIVRLPFRALASADAFFKTINERAEAYTLASRQAIADGFNMNTREFREQVVKYVQNPTKEMQAAIEQAGLRFTFNLPLGEAGQAVQNVVRKTHSEWVIPFVRTPANIAKELLRMTPAAPIIGEWRAAIKKGGVERDKALAELAVGTAIGTVVMSYAFDGSITGAGEPDKGKRNVQQAAGWQPYSIKIGDTYYNYQRLQPLGTLFGMAADIAEIWDHLTEEESDKVPKMMSVAFANAITNQTFLQGVTSIVNALSDPKRFGPKFVQQFAASMVPNIIGQPTQMMDPVVREVDSILDAVKARVPGLRQALFAKLDIFGEPVKTKERLGFISPVTETTESDDKARSEAMRLGLSVADTPKKTHIGRGTGKLGQVELEPEERNRFSEVGGKTAYQIIKQMVDMPMWDALPDMAKKRAMERAMTVAHRIAALQAMPIEKRLRLSQEITEKVVQALQPEAVE